MARLLREASEVEGAAGLEPEQLQVGEERERRQGRSGGGRRQADGNGRH